LTSSILRFFNEVARLLFTAFLTNETGIAVMTPSEAAEAATKVSERELYRKTLVAVFTSVFPAMVILSPTILQIGPMAFHEIET